MPRTALILGASGRFGRNAANALERSGWTIRRFNRNRDDLNDAAMGADIIVNAWNPLYAEWAKVVPGLTQQVIKAARASGARVFIPGNIYVYGANMPPILTRETPHLAQNPLGRLRRDLEDAYRQSGVKTVVLRGGDFLDTKASGSWFDRIIAKKVASGVVTYPGDMQVCHAWAYLPDMTDTLVRLANHPEDLPEFLDLPFDGYNLTGTELVTAMSQVLGRPLRGKSMAWLPIKLARPFWQEAKYLLEMRYLWNTPHSVDGAELAKWVPERQRTPLHDALRRALADLT
ncbi:epimerase [Gymnodinialimonas sp. 2305UL16-5]|uniref:epimerase n=1 Tax=Gymnodinialimonas mytili TaxID=3126503 RepID=UPI0030976125